MFTLSKFGFTKPILACLFAALLSACASNNEPLGNRGFKTARAQSSLELPPDLINSSDALLKRRAAAEQNAVLPTLAGLSIKSAGDKRWLEINANAEDVWLRLGDYARKSGLPILSENKLDGILETDWIGDDSGESSLRTKVRSRLGNIAGRPPVNDKYTFWLEKIDASANASKTALHITHTQLKEYVIEPKNQHDFISTGWTETSGDGFKALQMLRNIATFLGGADIETENNADVVLVQTEPAHIILAETSAAAWQRTERAIRSSVYTIDKINRDKNRFIIKQPKDKGFFAKLSIKKRYAVQLETASDDNKTRIVIRSPRGNLVETSEALTFLYAIAGELRK